MRNQGVKAVAVSLLAGVILGGAALAGPLTLKEHRIAWSGAMPVQAHNGTLTPKAVDLAAGADGVIERLRVVLDMTSIANEDIKKEGSRKKLEAHLRSEDFFHVEKYPEATFEMKAYDGKMLSGVLTIRGISKDITVPATFNQGGDGHWTLETDFSFNRQEFNVNYQNRGLLGTAKNKLIADEVKVKVSLVFAGS
ncbi:MAG TPA: YceI family protein [Kiritimatiellia bacterium]|nr:YceI family protein [Kiritimatiellia bacterium]